MNTEAGGREPADANPFSVLQALVESQPDDLSPREDGTTEWGTGLDEALSTLIDDVNAPDETHPSDAVIDEMLTYVAEEYRTAERERLYQLDPKLLESMLAIMRENIGPASEYVSKLNMIYAERLADPAHRVVSSAFESSANSYDKLAMRLARAISDDPLVHALTNGDFRQAARDNVNALSVLSGMIRSMEVPLSKYLNKQVPSHNDLAMPANLAHLMNVLRHASAHLQTAHSHNESLEVRLAEHRVETEALRERLRTRTTEIEGLRDAPAYQSGPKFLRNKKTGEFLANRLAPGGRVPKHLPIHKMYWTFNLDEALKFSSEANVFGVVQRWIDLTVKRAGDNWDETLLGVHVSDLVPAELCVRNR